jgi:hypothetical protein
MCEQPEPQELKREQLARLEEHLRCRLTGHVRDLRLLVWDDGLVLRGRAHTYHAKLMAQQAVLEATDLPLRANEIEVL